jgi:hypothetical protein
MSKLDCGSTVQNSPLPSTVSTVETMSSPDTVITQSTTLTDEAYVRGKGADEWHGPAKIM